ncbi:MAG TPA: M42 family metallopeptidase [Thermoanaerobacterales bacterium]|nr:M42 family metallopeptidase [Thermoanaerobacterales bacterium]
MDLKKALIRLIEPAIPSGSEIENGKLIREAFLNYCDDVKCDNLGNIIGFKRGLSSDYKLMLAAHMDEIGLMVKHIDEEGFIRFAFVGGVDRRILPNQEVIIHGRKKVPGIIGNKPPHIQEPEERKKMVKAEDMFIDTGFPVQDVQKYITIGDFITFKRKPVELFNNCFSSNALDNRAGIAVMLYTLQQLTKLKHTVDVYTVATAQEEVGLRGAIVSSYGIYPDIGIAVDVCHGDMPDTPEYDTQKLGSGPVLALGPNIHSKLFERLKQIAEDHKIPYQLNPESSSTGTDAWAIQITKEGIPTALVSIPLRYMHTTVETLCLDDIKMSGRLISLFISSICNDFVEGLQCY